MLRTMNQTSAGWAPLFLRLALGVMLFSHGAQHLLGWFGGAGFSNTLAFMSREWHFPAFLAVLVIAAEFLGGLSLLVGLFTRFSALAVGFTLTVAAFKVHWGYGFFMNWTGQKSGEGIEFHLLAVGIALALVATGGGQLSLDRSFFGRGHRRR